MAKRSRSSDDDDVADARKAEEKKTANPRDASLARMLDWSAKQGRILTANGRAPRYYTGERGFPFREDELPHHHLSRRTTHEAFAQFAAEHEDDVASSSSSSSSSSVVVGAWSRPLFVGEWEHSTSEDEFVANVQTDTLFVDLRLPTSWRDGDDDEEDEDSATRRRARRHAFAGFAARASGDAPWPARTRHHCVDWNYVGTPRNRPNKWYAEPGPRPDVWKEWSFARDDHGRHYYWERWERLPGGGGTPVLALRKAKGAKRDGVVVVVGNRFNYAFDRVVPDSVEERRRRNHAQCETLVDLVDDAVAAGDRELAEAYLSLDAGHGEIDSTETETSRRWTIQRSTRSSEREGQPLFGTAVVEVLPDAAADAPKTVLWNDEPWDVLECDLRTCDELHELLTGEKKE